MIKHGLIAGFILAVPALVLAPRGGQESVRFVRVAQADAAPTADDKKAQEELAAKAWAVMEKHCISCHGVGKKNHRASPIDRTTYAKLIDKEHVVPGKPGDSPLYTYMISEDEPMPPLKIKERPTKEEIETIKVWIEKGAPAWQVEDKAEEKAEEKTEAK
jgi:mono/diheme cytochrome c family protein